MLGNIFLRLQKGLSLVPEQDRVGIGRWGVTGREWGRVRGGATRCPGCPWDEAQRDRMKFEQERGLEALTETWCGPGRGGGGVAGPEGDSRFPGLDGEGPWTVGGPS